MFSFWKIIFQTFQNFMLTSTAYHLQTNGQSEKINQNVEIIFLYYIFSGKSNWMRILPFFQTLLNYSVNISIGFFPNEFFYSFKINDTIKLLSDFFAKNIVRLHFTNSFAENFDRLRFKTREKAKISIFFALIINKIKYDKIYKSIEIEIHVFYDCITVISFIVFLIKVFNTSALAHSKYFRNQYVRFLLEYSVEYAHLFC